MTSKRARPRRLKGVAIVEANWFQKPWTTEALDLQNLAYIPTSESNDGEDGDAAALQTQMLMPTMIIDDVTNIKEELVDHGLDATEVTQHEVRIAIGEMLDTLKEGPAFEEPIIPTTKIRICVAYEGNQIYKSTLVSQLNGNPFCQKDRLTLVKNSVYFNNLDAYLNAAFCSDTCFLGLGSDCGVYFVNTANVEPS